MKKTVKIGIVIAILSLLGYLVTQVFTKMQYKKEVAIQLQTLPQFNFTTLKGKIFTQDNLKPNTATVFIYFNSECDYCQHEAQSIYKNLEAFKNAQLIFVSEQPKEKIAEFANTYKLNNQPNITFLHDATYTFAHRFDATSIPYTLIYNKTQQLVKKQKGQLLAKTIVKALQ